MKKLLYAVLLFLPSMLQAQNTPQGVLRGNFQFLAQQYSADSLINATVPASKASINGFGNFLYTHGKFPQVGALKLIKMPFKDIVPKTDTKERASEIDM